LAGVADWVRTRFERLEGGVRRVLRPSALGRALRRRIVARVLTARVLSVVSGCAIGHVLAGSAACLLGLFRQRMLPRMMRAIRLATALGQAIDVRAGHLSGSVHLASSALVRRPAELAGAELIRTSVGFPAAHSHQRLLWRRRSTAAGIRLSWATIRTA
jgi:hypothetical protein